MYKITKNPKDKLYKNTKSPDFEVISFYWTEHLMNISVRGRFQEVDSDIDVTSKSNTDNIEQ